MEKGVRDMERGKTIIPIDKILQCRTKGGTVKTLQIAGFVTEVLGLKGSDKLWEAKPWPTHHRGHSPPGLQLRPEQPCGQFLVSHHGLCQSIEFCSCLGGCCGLTWPPHVPRGAPWASTLVSRGPSSCRCLGIRLGEGSE